MVRPIQTERQQTRLYEVVDPKNVPAPGNILWGTNDLPQAVEHAGRIADRQGWKGIAINVSDPSFSGWDLKAVLKPRQIWSIRAQLAGLIH